MSVEMLVMSGAPDASMFDRLQAVALGKSKEFLACGYLPPLHGWLRQGLALRW